MSGLMWKMMFLAIQSLILQVRADKYIKQFETSVNNSQFTAVREGDNITITCTVLYHSNILPHTSTPYWYVQSEPEQQTRDINPDHIYGNGMLIPPYRLEDSQTDDGFIKHINVTLMRVSYHFRTLALRCGLHLIPSNGDDSYNIMDKNTIVIRIDKREQPTDSPTSTTNADTPLPTETTTTTITTKTDVPSSGPTGSASIKVDSDKGLSTQDQTVSMTTFIGVVGAAGALIVAMVMVIIGLLVCQRRNMYHYDTRGTIHDATNKGYQPKEPSSSNCSSRTSSQSSEIV